MAANRTAEKAAKTIFEFIRRDRSERFGEHNANPISALEKVLDSPAGHGEKGAMEPVAPPPPPNPGSWKEKPLSEWGGPRSPNLWKWILAVLGGGCLCLSVLAVTFAGFVILVVFGALKQSDVYQTAVARAKTDARVLTALGPPVKEGWYLSGSTKVNGGSGGADLTIPISGSKGKGTIYAVATKSAGEWTFSKLSVKINSSGETIDLNP